MPLGDEARLVLGFLLALAGALAATPLAIAVANRTDFYDRPVDYKAHGSPTPYLGGAAVVGAFLLAAVVAGADVSRLLPIFICAVALWTLGTLDDRYSLSPITRLAVEATAGIGLWSSGLGWSVTSAPLVDPTITVLWVVAVVNAFNLMDNMDGAAGTVGAVTSLAISVMALTLGDPGLAGLTLALSGACVGFLPYNLSAPSRIFLGDGGSLPIGFVVAATVMALQTSYPGGWPILLVAVLLAGLPVLDTALVIVSRRRLRRPVFLGGRDHLSHRLLVPLSSARRVALLLGLTQAVLACVAIGAVQLGRGAIVLAWTTWFVTAGAVVALLESEGSTTFRIRADAGGSNLNGSPEPIRQLSVVEVGAIMFIGLTCGVSPFLYGFYAFSVWGPITLFALAILIGVLVARDARLRRPALFALIGLVGLWLWSLLSSLWAESADQAVTESNRLLLYAAFFSVLVLLLRNDLLGRLLMAIVGAAVGVFALYITARLCLGTGGSLFLGGRLNGPLGYVNGEAAYLLLGFWPFVALAERAKGSAVSALAVATAVLVVGLAVLSQSRAAILALGLSAVVMLAAVSGRRPRLWVLGAVLAGALLCLGPLLAVYDKAGGRNAPPPDVLRSGAVWLIAAASITGFGWAAAKAFANRLTSATRTRIGTAVGLAACGAAVVAVGVGVTRADNLASQATRQYQAFVQLQRKPAKSTRFLSGGGARYDYWRIAAQQFESHPFRGVGAGNYDRTYFIQRRTVEDVRQPHSIELQTLAELGAVGGLALLAFIGGIAAGFVGRARDSSSGGNPALAVAAGGMFTIWLAQTSVDWLHLLPGVTGVALCGAAALVGPSRIKVSPAISGRRVPVVIACVLLAMLGAVIVGRSALADRYRSEAQRSLAEHPARALAKAKSALDLDDESLPAYFSLSAAYARLGDYQGAKSALVEARRREPHGFLPWALLGDLAVRHGEPNAARVYYRRASVLNPRDTELRALSARRPKQAAQN